MNSSLKKREFLPEKKRMTYSEALKFCCDAFEKNGIENYGNESRWLLESVDDGYMLKLRDEMPAEDTDEFFELADRRICGEPLQYLIGEWEFYGYEYCVGKGVLIPRPETEMLVDFAKEYLKGKNSPVVLDLCAGTGCVGLSVAREIPESTVYLVEKFDDAFAYLERNAKNVKNARIIKGDIFDELDLPRADLLLSNPPYIKSDEIAVLQREVHFEPETALDGGKDGLIFYRRIAQLLSETRCECVAVECGEEQADEIKELFSETENTKAIKDFNGYDRVVVAENKTLN